MPSTRLKIPHPARTRPKWKDQLGAKRPPRQALIAVTDPARDRRAPEPIHLAVTTGFAEAQQTTILAAVPFAILGFVIPLFLRETPLRQPRGHTSGEDLAAAFETSVDPDAHLTDDEDAPRPENPPPRGATPPSLLAKPSPPGRPLTVERDHTAPESDHPVNNHLEDTRRSSLFLPARSWREAEMRTAARTSSR